MLEFDSLFWLKSLEVALIASLKFLLAPFEAERQGFNMFQAFLITTLGGLIGISAFTLAGQTIFAGWRHLLALLKSVFTRKPTALIEKKMPKKVKSDGAFIQWIRRRFGLAGIAFVTPCIISIPVGTLIAVGLYRSKLKILIYTSISLILWSLVLNFIAQYIKLSNYLSF